MTRIPKSELEAARAWRLRHNLTLEELAELTGYTFGSISHFERGVTGSSSTINPRSWRRFKHACELAHIKLARRSGEPPFNW